MEKYISPILENIRNANYEAELLLISNHALDYIKGIDKRSVYPERKDIEALSNFDKKLAKEPALNKEIINLLVDYGSKGTVAQTGSRYFGFVTGGLLPSALYGRLIADIWDQNSAMYISSPTVAKIEEVCEKWLVELFSFPQDTAAGFVSGSASAMLCALTTGRNFLLNRLGWDVNKKGLFGAPDIKVVVGEGAHSTVWKALSIIGFGSDLVIKVPMDSEGRIRVDLMPKLDSRTMIILQAGNVNTGAFDCFEKVCSIAKEAGAWVHIDGAFGLWAQVNPEMAKLTKGIELADSWNFDAHKTLNAPYDSGVVMCKDRSALLNAMQMSGDYIVAGANRDGMFYTHEMSRRARVIDIWAALMGLGSLGVAEMVQELHIKARYFAEGLSAEGFEILNEVVFNQVLVYYKEDKLTLELMKQLQSSGVMWVGGSTWQGKRVIRISVSSYRITYNDIDICIKEFVKQVVNL